ncbi:MAG: chemotaxis protein CheA [Dehalococcoidia bacterium]
MELAPDITAEDLKVFLEEAEEQLQLLDEDIIRLEKEEGNEALLQEIFRAAHTLKGSSAMLGHTRMSNLAHAMESVLDRVRKGTLLPGSGVVDALLHSLDGLRALNEELVSPDESEYDIASAVAELNAAMGGEGESASVAGDGGEMGPLALDDDGRERLQSAVAAGQTAYQVSVGFDKESTWTAVRCFQVVHELSQVGEVITSNPSPEDIEQEKVGFELRVVFSSFQGEEQVKGVMETVSDIQSLSVDAYSSEQAAPEVQQVTGTEETAELKAAEGAQAQASQAHTAQTVRIDVERLDSMMNMIGELVIATSRILQIGKTLEGKYADDLVQELGRSSAHTTKVVNELQEDIMRIRMLPVATVFSGFPRMIRDLAQKSKKKVDFIVEGQETGIDRTVIEHIRDPLVHLLRNSVDHGIEPTEDRKAAGKPEMATLRLSACHEEGHIVLTVEDDGKGISAAVVKESAVKKGFVTAEDAARMSEDEAIGLIFASGMSTKEQATEVSGRGVGLDIVRKNVETLNGYVKVDTKVGKGTKFTVRLPLTLATVDSLLVMSSGALYAIPVVSVLETARLLPKEISTIGGREVIRLRGGVLPLLRLDRTLGMELPGGRETDDSGRIPVVVVRGSDRLVALAVDELVEKQEIVVKSMGDQLGDVKGISGASILGDGRLALIIDAPTLVATAV